MNATKRATLDCFCPNLTINFSFRLATSIAHSKTWASPFWWDCWVVRAAGSNAGLWQLLYLRPGRKGAPWVSSNQSDPGMENKVPCPTTHHSTVHWIVAVLLFNNTEKSIEKIEKSELFSNCPLELCYFCSRVRGLQHWGIWTSRGRYIRVMLSCTALLW